MGGLRSPSAAADWPFFLSLSILGGAYVLLIAAMLAAEASYTSPAAVWNLLANPAIRYAVWLSLISSTITAVLSVWAAVPLGYLLARFRFPGRRLIDVLLDVPIVLPPLVVGLCLLILFQTPPGRLIEQFIPVTYAIPSVILAQLAVSCAFATRVTRATFEQIPRRREEVAMTLGCSRGQAFWRVTLPEARRGSGVHAGLGAGAGRVRADPGVFRGDALPHGGAFDDGVPGAERRRPARGARGVAGDGRGGGDRLGAGAAVWWRADAILMERAATWEDCQCDSDSCLRPPRRRRRARS